MKDRFLNEISAGYAFKGESITLGGAMLENDPISNCIIKAPLSVFNRHGLIAGATGTGKTKSLQVIAEGLSEKGVATILMDIKGDLSGISQPGLTNQKIEERCAKIGIEWTPEKYPVEFLSLSKEKGCKLRATVSEFGPTLFSKILELNETQASVISLIFKYCDDNGLALLDLKDLKKALQYLTNEGKMEIEKEYGRINTSTASIILRKIIEIEQQGAEEFFGELSFDPEDLLRIDDKGRGYINILRLMDIQSKPKLFSTFMLCLLAEIYEKFPEEGDLDQPKLVLFIDEAHLIFKEASKTLLSQIETIIKLIRSKGVGVFFCTQNPADIPSSVLSQLGMKIQHSLRAFTANDRKAIKLAAANYPISDYYKTEDVITSLGIGEALITTLNEKGNPTPLVRSMMTPPRTRMDVISDEELSSIVDNSALCKKYNELIDRESAYEILTKKLESIPDAKSENTKTVKNGRQASPVGSIMKSPVVKEVGRTVAREITRGILGAIGFGGGKRKGLF